MKFSLGQLGGGIKIATRETKAIKQCRMRKLAKAIAKT